MNAQDIVDYTKSLDCVHCGLCLRTCPTYRDTGRESASPRGRIHMMRSVAEGATEVDRHWIDELDGCLVCRNCESVCPSGVEYNELMAHTRAALADSSQRSALGRESLRFGLRTVLTSRGMIDLFAAMLRLGQRLGLLGAFGSLGKGASNLPPVPPARERQPLAPTHPAQGRREGEVAVLEGCVMPVFFSHVNRATVEVLQAAGREVHVPRGATCCGALQAHNGELETARLLARQMIESMESVRDESGELLPVVVNSAGCAAQMKEYGQLLAEDPEFAERAARFAGRVKDFSEYLAEEAPDRLAGALSTDTPEVPSPLTFDDPCHLCHGQGVRSQPRELLDHVAAERVELEESESCCGSAGLFATLRPEESQRILAPRLEALNASGARTLVTANPGCQLQWQSGVQQAGIDAEVLHIAEVLRRSLKAESAPKSTGTSTTPGQ